MKSSKDTRSTAEVQPPVQVMHDLQSNRQNQLADEAPGTDSSSIPATTGDNRKVSHEDIELVQNLIERCLQLYMNKAEVVRTLSTRARIEPGFTTLVWQKLEEENSEFFRAYYIRLKLKKQIILFNQLLEHQYHLMKFPAPPKVPLTPIQNEIHHMPEDLKLAKNFFYDIAVNNLPMGYPVLQQPPMPTPGQPHLNSMGCGPSSCHVVNGIPAPGNFHPICMNSGNDIVMDNGTPEASARGASSCNNNAMAMSPASGASSNNHFPFTPSEISGMAMDASFASEMGSEGTLQLGHNGESNSLATRSDPAKIWFLSDLGDLENYTGSLFLPSDSDILLGSPDQDDIVEEYFADVVTSPCSQPDEEK
uniref:Uncharacterized protein n=1 Tax=Ananas comosus var. bracteatus TaxID=296719 RepID=A0A6V7QHJ4_ANACO|nr:unnamed protein product [Ananas comosus var. bracteatus]